jgi:hypothetical protein
MNHLIGYILSHFLNPGHILKIIFSNAQGTNNHKLIMINNIMIDDSGLNKEYMNVLIKFPPLFRLVPATLS